MSNLGDVIINQLIGALIGTVVSFIVSWYFYKKADFPSRTSGEMTETILVMMIGLKMGLDFNLFSETAKSELPKNTDVPHINRFFSDKSSSKPGETLTLLFRVEDSGFDGAYIDVLETASNIGFPVERQGHGFYSCKIQFAKNAIPGFHTILVNLRDKKNLKFSQSVKYEITNKAG
jgi:hypothetical protein